MMRRWSMAAALAAAAWIFPADAGAAACGDLNDDGSVAIGDVILLQRAALEEPDPAPLCGGAGALACGDINDDGAISIGDVVILFNHVLGNETLYPLCVGTGPTIACPGGQTTISSNVTSNQVWPAGCDIFLDGTIFVDAGVVLKIDAGATIFGKKFPTNPQPSALIFRQDAKINAVGSPSSPIVFSSDASVGSRSSFDWGGVAINGRAPVNCPGGTCAAMDGITGAQIPFGGTEANDSSGIARFLRIEFAGFEAAPGSELNLLSLNGVGRGTTIDHIQVNEGLFDGIAWFGGTVNAKHLIASGASEDLFDWQLGYTGAVQFVFGAQEGGNLANDGDGLSGTNNKNGPDFLPRSAPSFCNVTLLGSKGQVGGNVLSHCLKLSTGTAGQVHHGICAFWNTGGIKVSSPATYDVACDPDGTQNLSGDLMVQESILWDVGDNGSPSTEFCDGASTGVCSTTRDLCSLWSATATPLQEGTNPGFVGGGPFAYGTIPRSSRPAVTSSFACSTVDAWFDDTDYIGAFDPDVASPDWATSPWVRFDTQ